jgi:hypothetical protein
VKYQFLVCIMRSVSRIRLRPIRIVVRYPAGGALIGLPSKALSICLIGVVWLMGA